MHQHCVDAPALLVDSAGPFFTDPGKSKMFLKKNSKI
jgi:hypothetical protein